MQGIRLFCTAANPCQAGLYATELIFVLVKKK